MSKHKDINQYLHATIVSEYTPFHHKPLLTCQIMYNVKLYVYSKLHF